MKDVDVYGNVELTDMLNNEFLLGRVGNLSEEHEEIVTKVRAMIAGDFTFNECQLQMSTR